MISINNSILKIQDQKHHKNVWCSLNFKVKNGNYLLDTSDDEILILHSKFNQFDWEITNDDFGIDSGNLLINHQPFTIINSDKNLNIIASVYIAINQKEIIGIKISY